MEELLPTKFYLSRNSPDPFNKKTLIKYCLPKEARIKLEIISTENEKIKTLVDEVKEPGTHQVEFKSNGIKEGIYICRMIAGRFMMARRMLYLK